MQLGNEGKRSTGSPLEEGGYLDRSLRAQLRVFGGLFLVLLVLGLAVVMLHFRVFVFVIFLFHMLVVFLLGQLLNVFR